MVLIHGRSHSITPHHEKVVTPVMSELPHTDVQRWRSTQAPANPQSLAWLTVWGQNPQSAFLVSTLHAYPLSAVRGCFGSPVKKPHVDLVVVSWRASNRIRRAELVGLASS